VPVDEASRAAGAIDRAAKKKESRIAFESVLREPGGERAALLDIELGRKLRPLCTLAHHGGVAAAADEELDGVDENRLAGARFAGEDAKASSKLERGFLDQHEVLNLEASQHR
jgi:hypothetical protein